MRQHPIPQDITNYKFHLIGKMTLKQFGELAAGVIIAVIIYSTNLIGIVKWGLILFSVGFAAIIAFVPIEERPMDHWIITFFKNLWRPTKFFWKRKNEVPDFMNYKIHQINQEFNSPEVDLNPARKQRIYEYLNSIPKNGKEVDAWDRAENQRITSVISSFDEVKVDQKDIEIKEEKKEKPNLKTRVRNLKAPSRLEAKEKTEIVNENPKPVLEQLAETQITEPVLELKNDTLPQPILELKNDSLPQEETSSLKEEENIPTITETEAKNPITAEPILETAIDTADPEPVGAEIPVQEEVQTIPIEETQIEETTTENQVPQTETTEEEITPETTETPTEILKSKINNELPIPTRPDVPNKLAGMIFNQAGEIIPNALIEIKNKKGQSNRIVKSNQFGQFFIRTPLGNGKYQLFTESGNYQFEPFDLKLKGEIVPPIEIRSLS
jgi:hypothetical protein